MKLLTLAATALVAATAIIAPAEARPQYSFCGEFNNGEEYCVSNVGSRSVQLTVDNKFNKTGFTGHMDCGTRRLQWRDNEGWSEAQMRHMLNGFCNM